MLRIKKKKTAKLSRHIVGSEEEKVCKLNPGKLLKQRKKETTTTKAHNMGSLRKMTQNAQVLQYVL